MRILATSYARLKNDWYVGDTITVVAGENGCGKSSFLSEVADSCLKKNASVLAVSGTVHHRFPKKQLSGRLLVPGASYSDPEVILKRAIAHAVKTDELLLRTLSRVLRHCGYYPVVGIEVEPPLRWQRVLSDEVEREAHKLGGLREDLESVILHLQSNVMTGEVDWLDFDSHHYGYSIKGKLADVVFWERALKSLGVIKGVRLHLQNNHRSLSLGDASSGELSLITSLAFIAVYANETDVLLIDEPENSLHPKWQRDYIQLLRGAVGYSDTKIVIATHSPLMVLAASETETDVGALVLSSAFKADFELDGASLEEVLAEVFNTYTPRNNYLSKTLVDLMDKVENGQVSAEQADRNLQEIKVSGVDERQENALAAVSKVVAQMVAER